MKISIVGTGLIGCSLGLALKKQGHHLIGVDLNSHHLEQALQIGAIDQHMPMALAAKTSDLVMLCTPVDVSIGLLNELLDEVDSTTTVMDMGSTKAAICDSVADHPRRGNFVAVHPMAGVEHSGPQAAHVDLFLHARVIVCEAQRSNTKALNKVLEVLQSLSMRVNFMDPQEHDRLLALVSHLPQLMAYALGALGEWDNSFNREWTQLGGGGLRSSLRLAKSEASMWIPVFQQNKSALLGFLDQYIAKMEEMRQLISTGRDELLNREIKTANSNYDRLHAKDPSTAHGIEVDRNQMVHYS